MKAKHQRYNEARDAGRTDMLFFGPGDFSLMSGVPGEIDSDVVRNGMAETAAAAQAAGKRFGTLVTNMDQAKRALDLGASLLTYGGDLHFVRAALMDVREQFAALGVPFRYQLSVFGVDCMPASGFPRS